MPQVFYILFGAAFTAAICLAAGALLLRRLGVSLHAQEEPALAYVCGAALLSAFAFLLCVLHLVYKPVLLGAGLTVLGLAWRRGAFRRPPDSFPPLPRKAVLPAAVVLLPFFALTLFHAMAPEMSPDGVTYHLGLVSRYYRNRGFLPITTNIYANISQGIELLFLHAYAFGRHSAAALVHFSFLPALCLLLLSYGRRFGFPVAGLAAAVIIFVSPVFGIDAASAYNDVATAAVVFALFYFLRLWDDTPRPALLVPIGILAGFAYACKYTAFLAVPFAAGWIVFRLWRTPRLLWRPLIIVGVLVSLMVLPWMIKNIVLVANPVSPFFNQHFPNPYVTPAFEQEYRTHMRNYDGLGSHWDIPLEVTVRGHALGGLLGPLFLLTPVALLSLGRPHGRRLLLAALVFGLTYAGNIGTRFLIPAAPFLALAFTLALDRFRPLLAVLVLAHAISSWPQALQQYCATYAWRLDEFLLLPALRIESEEDFLHRKWPGYAVARMIETEAPPEGKVLSFNQANDAYTTREVIVPYQSAFGQWLGELQWTPLIPDYAPVRLIELRFPRRELSRIRLLQTASGAPDNWSVSELRLYQAGREVRRQPQWRIRANPYPWGVPYAFDGSEVTRWKSWEPLRSGMFIEVDLQTPTALDAISVQCSQEQRAIRLAVATPDADGNWRPIEAEQRDFELAPPLGLRRAVMREIKAAGVSHLLIHEGDFEANDYLEKQQRWGIKLVRQSHGFFLYRIE